MRRLRGRPRHDDVLTPREWEVLSLLREGLTNEQIAERLGVSFDTAKFHVSEILGKLGVESRQAAAAWRGAPRGVPVPAAATVWQRVGLTSPLRVFAASMLATVAVGLLALAGGLLLMSSRDGAGGSAPGVESRTGDEALDAMIESLLTGDAASLASRFAGVTAREGVVVGGPVGIYQPATVPAPEWTARLAASTRELYAVVRDPVEPYPWNQSPAPPGPRAAVFAGARDYDVLLIVTEPGKDQAAWRMSLEDGRVVDLIIDGVPANAAQPYPESTTPLLLQLRNLMPSVDQARGSFLILPPADKLPPPVEPGAPGPRLPSGAVNPPHAPAGRTGIGNVDRVIDALVSDSAVSLALAFADVSGTQEDCEPNGPWPGTCPQRYRGVTPAEWTQRLADGRQGLYAVTTSQTGQVDVFIGVDGGDYAYEVWRFTLTGGRIISLRIIPPIPLAILDPAVVVTHDKWGRMENYAPNPAREYEQFYVLPPEHLLPKPPAGHDLSVRTGTPSVDSLLAILAAKDPSRFTAALATPGATLLRKCGDEDKILDAAASMTWAQQSLPKVINLASVIKVPVGYQPEGDHIILANVEMSRYRWGTLGLVERGGRIVALLESGDWCPPNALYPPASYLVPPPPPGAPRSDPSRRSGIPLVDAVLDAAYTGDAARLDSLISYGTPCGPEYAPPCPPGVPPGTVVEGLMVTACHGGYATRAEAPQAVIDAVKTRALYAAVDQGGSDGLNVVLVSVNEGVRGRGTVALTFDGKGLRSIHFDCAGFGPDGLLNGGNPNFLLPPP